MAPVGMGGFEPPIPCAFGCGPLLVRADVLIPHSTLGHLGYIPSVPHLNSCASQVWDLEEGIKGGSHHLIAAPVCRWTRGVSGHTVPSGP